MAVVLYTVRGQNSVGCDVQFTISADNGTSDAKIKEVTQNLASILATKLEWASDGVTFTQYTGLTQTSTIPLTAGVTCVVAGGR